MMFKRLIIAVVVVGAVTWGALALAPSDPQVVAATEAVLNVRADLARPVATPADRALPPSRPNIIVILADDLGWRDVGFNHSEIRTPNLDRLAADGITLNRFYAQPTCSPTRAALLTGKAPLRLGIVDPLSKNNPKGLPLSETTLAERLRREGYQTALTGKWHLGARNLAYHPNARGFDHFYGHLTGAVGYFDKVHGGGYDWQRNGVTVREDGYTTHLITREAVEVIITRDPDRPFFLYAAYGAPHLPNEAPEAAIAAYPKIDDERRRVHAAMVSELDTAVGTLQATLVDEGIAENTLIWFMSDNGGLFPTSPVHRLPEPLFRWAAEMRMGMPSTLRMLEFLRRNLGNGAGDNRPFEGGKGAVTEGGVRVPAFLHWPGTLEAGLRYNYMATAQDVLPTLMAVIGEPVADDAVDGINLWSGLTTNTPAPINDYIVQTERLDRHYALYRYPHKLIVHDTTPVALYNVETDPLEATNLLRREPELANTLAAALVAFPRGERVLLSLEDTVQDPDFFGGEEDRAPWAERAYPPEAADAPDAQRTGASIGHPEPTHATLALERGGNPR